MVGLLSRVAWRAGLVLLTVSALVFGFAGWQLWGTGLQTARSQDRLESEFEAQLGELATVPDTSTTVASVVPSTDAATSTTVVPSTVPPATDTAPTSAPSPTMAPPTTHGTRPVTVPSKPTTASNWFKVSQGDPVARIQIGAIGVDAYVVAGTRVEDLKKGPGHFPGSVLPGQVGNSVIAGHRTTYGAVFGDLDRVQPGDQVVVTIPTGDRYVYTVTSSEVLQPDAVASVMGWTEDAQLTLFTCTPKFTAHARLVVHARLEPGLSSVLWEAPPDPLTQYVDVGPSAPAADVVETHDVEVVDSVTGATVTVVVPADVEADEVTVADGEVVYPGSDEVQNEGATVSAPEVLSDGWFADRGAWPHVAGWAFALACVVGLVRVAVRRLRARLQGGWARRGTVAAVVLVALLPGLFCLFWFYDAVARLMPAGS